MGVPNPFAQLFDRVFGLFVGRGEGVMCVPKQADVIAFPARACLREAALLHEKKLFFHSSLTVD